MFRCFINSSNSLFVLILQIPLSSSVGKRVPSTAPFSDPNYMKQPTKCTSIFLMYFIQNILTNMFRPVYRPSSGWCYYYSNTKRTDVVSCAAVTAKQFNEIFNFD